MGAELFYADRQTDEWTERHDEDNMRFTLFYQGA